MRSIGAAVAGFVQAARRLTRKHPALAVFAILLANTPAVAGDRAMIDFIGYSQDMRYFAYEEYGVSDGVGLAYSTIYIVDLIRRVTEGRTLLVVEHDMSVVFTLCDQISVLVYGQVIASGEPAAVRANPKVQEAYLGEEVHQ